MRTTAAQQYQLRLSQVSPFKVVRPVIRAQAPGVSLTRQANVKTNSCGVHATSTAHGEEKIDASGAVAPLTRLAPR